MKKCIFLIFLLAATACGKRTPKGVLDPEAMAAVLIDMHIAEAKIDNVGTPPDSARVLQKIMLKEILKDHGIEEETYYNSYDYYLENLPQFENVYAIVVDSLSLREKLLHSRQEE